MRKNLPILVTNSAWKKIEDIAKIKNNKNFLLSVKSGGCNGFNYKFENINQIEKNMNFLNNKNVNIYIDPRSEFLLLGTKIDYITELYESKFQFIADKTKNVSCGCGTSFSPK
jgi:iron-sulfur cluster assembly accessory protein|uniref:FeS cluster biogenesis domain-containing protein n=1 Tax=viral metagenome TaxID=1070528 RepID=A0A6C0JRB4_9ZZZZ